MASSRQRAAARRNVKKAASAARRKRTLTRLPKKTRTALGKQAAKAARTRSPVSFTASAMRSAVQPGMASTRRSLLITRGGKWPASG